MGEQLRIHDLGRELALLAAFNRKDRAGQTAVEKASSVCEASAITPDAKIPLIADNESVAGRVYLLSHPASRRRGSRPESPRDRADLCRAHSTSRRRGEEELLRVRFRSGTRHESAPTPKAGFCGLGTMRELAMKRPRFVRPRLSRPSELASQNCCRSCRVLSERRRRFPQVLQDDEGGLREARDNRHEEVVNANAGGRTEGWMVVPLKAVL